MAWHLMWTTKKSNMYKKKQGKKNLVQQKIQVINDMTAHIWHALDCFFLRWLYHVAIPDQSTSLEKIILRCLLYYNTRTVRSEQFLYKVALPELKNLPIMYFVMNNTVVLSKILKIVVPFWLLFVYVDYYQNNQFYRVKNRIFKILLLWHNNFQYFG